MKRLKSVTLRQLRALRAVDEARSISGAAVALNLTPPAVHSQLKALEGAVGATLLHRDGTSAFTTTEEGRILLEAEARIASALRAALSGIDAARQGLVGNVMLGVVSTGKYFAPGLVAELHRAAPDIKVGLKVGNRDAVIAALEEEAIDLAIMGRPPRAPQVEARVIGDHPHVLIAPPDHPLAGRAASAQDILSQVLILREEGSGTRILATRFLDRLGEGRPYQTMIMDSNETIKQAVIAGLGIALISLHTVTEELRAGRLVTLSHPELPILRSWFMLHRADRILSGAERRVLEFIDARKGGFLPRI